MDAKHLISEAVLAQKQAYTPYSHFPVGAVIVTQDDTIYHGCNIENASYGLTNCAERTAVFKAVSEGKTTFKAVAVVGDTEGPIAPCGACRQVLAEFCSEDTRIFLANRKGDVMETNITQLLPGSFSADDLI